MTDTELQAFYEEIERAISDLLNMPEFDGTQATSQERRDTKRRAVALLAKIKDCKS